MADYYFVAQNYDIGTRLVYGSIYNLVLSAINCAQARDFHAKICVYGATNINTMATFLTEPTFAAGSSGTIGNVVGLFCAGGGYSGSSTSVITTWDQINVACPVAGSTRRGIYIENITGGATANYAIYSAGGSSYHAGQFLFGSNITLANGASLNLQESINYTGATTENKVLFPDNLAAALTIGETGYGAYITLDSRDAAELVLFSAQIKMNTGIDIDVNGNNIDNVVELSNGVNPVYFPTGLIISGPGDLNVGTSSIIVNGNSGASGTTLNGDVVENGIITTIGT
jgi:hypothetical protein